MSAGESPEIIKLVQISDMHLMADAEQRYRGIDVEDHFDQILNHIDRHHHGADALLVTGDITQQPTLAAYRRIGRRLDRLSMPWYWIPGNHDDRGLMTAAWGAMTESLKLAHWRVTLLDSNAEPDSRGSGSLSATELERLQLQLQRPGPHLLVLHHNPMRVHSGWQDPISLGNRQAFLDCLHRAGCGGVVICGHVHQVWDQADGGWRLLSCPSTAVQFRKRCATLHLETEGDDALPGYRVLELGHQGSVETYIERWRAC